MPHIHELYDFVVTVFIVHRGKVLLIHHKKYDEWLPIGGHIEMDEDPEQALYREIREECGLKVRILEQAPKIKHPGVKPLPAPTYLDAHRISDTHKHVAFIYFGTSQSSKVRLHEKEHYEFRWLSMSQLKSLRPKLTKSIIFYCTEALKAARGLQ